MRKISFEITIRSFDDRYLSNVNKLSTYLVDILTKQAGSITYVNNPNSLLNLDIL